MTQETIQFLLKLLEHLKVSPLQPDALEVLQWSIKARTELLQELARVTPVITKA